LTIPVIGIGAGGHAKVLVEILRAMGIFQIQGLLDANPELHGSTVLGVDVLGDDTMLEDLYSQEITKAFIGIGSVGDTRLRRTIASKLCQVGMETVIAIHPTACVSPSASLGEGVAVMPLAIVGPGAAIGDHAILNSGTVIEHDCRVGTFAHVAPGAVLSGGVQVGEDSHVGAGVVVKEYVHIGRGCTVGAGSVVVKDVPDFESVVGVPARPMGQDVQRMEEQ